MRGVTVGVTDLADAGAASLADAGMAFPADPVGVVTVDVASLAYAGLVTVSVTDLADAGMMFPADPDGAVDVGVASLADAGLVTVGVTDLADAGAASLAAPADISDGVVMDWYVSAQVETVDVPVMRGGVVRDDSFVAGPKCDGGVVSCSDRMSPAVWCRERTQIRNALDCQYVNSVSCGLVGRGCAVPADGCTSSFGTLLSGPLCPVTNDMTYWEKLEALGGDSYDYDDGVGSQFGFFD